MINRENLSAIIKLMKKNQPLVIDEQVRMVKEFQNGNENILDLLIKTHLRLAWTTASKYKPFDGNNNITVEDLIQVAVIGMIEGFRKWDSERGDVKNALITYMKKELSSYVQLTKSTIVENQKQGIARRKYEKAIQVSLQKDIPLEELKMIDRNYSETDIDTARRNLAFSQTSLNDFGNEFEENHYTPISEPDSTFEDEDENNELRRILEKHIIKLTPKRQEMIRLHYFEQMEIKDIATLKEMSHQSVRELLKKAIRNLSDIMK